MAMAASGSFHTVVMKCHIAAANAQVPSLNKYYIRINHRKIFDTRIMTLTKEIGH